jgi:hypothetical protein
MPRNGSGSYSLPTGNPVVTGTTIESSWANTTMSDIGNELTNSLSRTGAGGMTGAFRAADGSSALPGIAWGLETSTGFYRAGTSDMRAVVATGLIQKWIATGTEISGSTTSKTYIATDTGKDRVLIEPQASGSGTNIIGTNNAGSGYAKLTLDGSILAFNYAGTEAMRLDSIGLGVGTTSPAFGSGSGVEIQRAGIATLRLENSTASNSFELYADSAANGINLRGRDSSPMVFWTANTEAARIDASGNLGIGVASPQAKLDVGGDYREKVNTANTGTAYTINLSDGTIQILTLTGNCTFTFPTATAGKSFMILLKQDGTGSRTVTWPASVKWPGGTTPAVTSTASRLDKFVFTADGTNWYGSNGGQNYTV